MGAYSYQALDAKGKTVKGVIEGDSERHVRNQLRSKQLKPLQVKTTRQRGPAAGSKDSGFSLFNRRPHMGYRDVSLVTRQLASLVQSGLPLDEVLASTAKQSRKPAAKTIMLQVRSRVLEGLSLAQAMAEIPRVFDGLYRAMVRAGESSGYLGPVLERLADYTERSQETKQKLKGAMVYPIIMMLVSISVVTLMMVKVVPNLVGMFERNKQELPFVTKFLIGASNFLVNYGVFLLLGIVGLIIAFQWALRAESRRKKWHSILLRAPVTGNLILQAESARYASTLGLLANSGVPLLEALRIAAQVLTNHELRAAAKEVAVLVQEGSSLHKALDSVEVFPPLLVQMAASGEANGKLAEQLLHAARNQERELEFTVNTALGLMEPFMVLFMGGVVTFIVIAILLPIFQMNQMVS
ncbi:type II secretion system inner membrane protein GspF [Teredinibacter turnerae]|uniref:General secretion pathway protein F n=1 Tax=Teredinibacter turnerae (strain ATCC 39867 / T7901) TaxID=377629 RepID=C5BLP1_TERTT|nr:type II secretion system inner membrane protein GspF [Teredinibacter turnerae]ACR12321.1 general secretion pathway protein F [Teredinibacter turnerae T7901]